MKQNELKFKSCSRFYAKVYSRNLLWAISTHHKLYFSRLYVNGWPVICTRQMEVAALVSAINPSLSAASDAIEVALLQQELLWLLYDLNNLAKYPMALGKCWYFISVP